jgi:hypothetical protein
VRLESTEHQIPRNNVGFNLFKYRPYDKAQPGTRNCGLIMLSCHEILECALDASPPDPGQIGRARQQA